MNNNSINMDIEESMEKTEKSESNTKDSINSISTNAHSNNSSLSSFSKINNSKEYNPSMNTFNVNFDSKEECLKYNGDYINELYSNLLDEEKNLITKPKYGYMKYQTDINEKIRAILVDWIIEIHDKFHLKSITLYQTIWLIDSYLSLKYIKRTDFQLLGLGSLYIACKFREIYYPQFKDFFDATDGAYTKEDILRIEKDILKTVNYNLFPPCQEDFYNIIAKSFGFNEKQYYLGKYFMENSLIDYNMIKYSSSVIAVSCSYIVMKFFNISNYKKLYSTKIICEKCPQKVIKDTARELCFLVKGLSSSEFKAIKEKYLKDKYYKVAEYCNNDL